MGSKLDSIIEKELIGKGDFPTWLQKSTQYEVCMGSTAYGCATDKSDLDVYGFCMPPKEIVFPHLNGSLHGFDDIKEFWQWQKHHIQDPSALAGKGQQYDFTIYNIIKYFKLCMDCNPNMVDSLFVPNDCVLHITPLAGMVRAKKDLFLSKKAFHKFTGYLHSQVAKLDRKPEGKRKESYDIHGFDLKFLYHAVRLASEISQILEFGTVDLRRDRELYKAIRRGDWTLDQGKKWLNEKEGQLSRLYESSPLRNTPARADIKQLLLDCLETYYGDLAKAEFHNPNRYQTLVEQIREIVR